MAAAMTVRADGGWRCGWRYERDGVGLMTGGGGGGGE